MKRNNKESINPWITVISIYVIGFFVIFNLLDPIFKENIRLNNFYNFKNTKQVETEYSFKILGKSAYVFDISNNKELYAKNINMILPLASITKVMTAIVALEKLPNNLPVTITKESLNMFGNNGLFLNEIWKLKNLVIYMLITSSNDAAIAIEKAGDTWFNLNTKNKKDFVYYMNEKASLLNMKNTIFRNTTGLETINNDFGGEGTVNDLSILFKYALVNHFDVFGLSAKQILKIKSLNKTHLAQNTDIIIDKIPGLLMSKTGFTKKAKGGLVIIYNKNINDVILISVLGSTFNGRFTDVQNIFEGLK